MNDSDNNDTFSNTPNEDWIENDKTNLLSDTSKDETSKFVEETAMPIKEEDEIQNPEEIEEIMNTDNLIEGLKKEILEKELDHKMVETEMTQIDELEQEEQEEELDSEANLNELAESESFLEALESNEKEEINSEESFLNEETEQTIEEQNEEKNNDEEQDEQMSLEADFEEEEFIDFNQEVLNGTQNDMLANVENIEINQDDFITDEVIDLDNDLTAIDELEDNDVFIEESSAFINEELNQEDMFRKPNFFFAILGGLGAILVSSLFWAESASLLDKYYNYDHKYAYMALLVGVCVGLGIRWAGRGKTYGFGIIAVILTLCGSLSGTLLSTLVHVVEAFDVSYFEILDVFDFTFLYGLLQDRFQNLDVAFYVSACMLAYWIAVRREKK